MTHFGNGDKENSRRCQYTTIHRGTNNADTHSVTDRWSKLLEAIIVVRERNVCTAVAVHAGQCWQLVAPSVRGLYIQVSRLSHSAAAASRRYHLHNNRQTDGLCG